jgi:hypothetical protein
MGKYTDEVEIGQRFYNAHLSAFGTPLQITWVVQQAWVGADGIPYARLVKESDRTQKKTVSARILEDRRHFVPAGI